MTDPEIHTLTDLRDLIDVAIDDVLRAAGINPDHENIDTNPHIRKIMKGVDQYTDIVRNRRNIASLNPAPTNVSSLGELRAVITGVLTETATEHAGPGEIDTALRQITDAAAIYANHRVEAALARSNTDSPNHVNAPALTYTHTEGRTMTDVDRGAVTSCPRERAIAHALILEALRLHHQSETTP